MLPLTPAVLEAIWAIEPGIATPDALEHALARFEPLVEALEAIRPGLKEGGGKELAPADKLVEQRRLAAYLLRLKPPRGNPRKPDAGEIERFRDALDGMTPASWLMVALRAAEDGYLLPSNLATMVEFVDDAAFRARTAPKTRKGKATDGHHVAGSCAALYFDLTHEPPKERNYASAKLGVCNNYAWLVKEAICFFCPGVSWGWLARDAARHLARVIRNE